MPMAGARPGVPSGRRPGWAMSGVTTEDLNRPISSALLDLIRRRSRPKPLPEAIKRDTGRFFIPVGNHATLPALLRAQATTRPDDIAVVSEDDHLTYAGLL